MKAGLRSTPSIPPELGSAPLSEVTWAESRQLKGEGPSLSERQADGASIRAWTEGRACAAPQRSPDTLYPHPHAYTLTLSHVHIPSRLTFTHAHTLTLTYIPLILTFTHMLALTYPHTHTPSSPQHALAVATERPLPRRHAVAEASIQSAGLRH